MPYHRGLSLGHRNPLPPTQGPRLSPHPPGGTLAAGGAVFQPRGCSPSPFPFPIGLFPCRQSAMTCGGGGVNQHRGSEGWARFFKITSTGPWVRAFGVRGDLCSRPSLKFPVLFVALCTHIFPHLFCLGFGSAEWPSWSRGGGGRVGGVKKGFGSNPATECVLQLRVGGLMDHKRTAVLGPTAGPRGRKETFFGFGGASARFSTPSMEWKRLAMSDHRSSITPKPFRD